MKSSILKDNRYSSLIHEEIVLKLFRSLLDLICVDDAAFLACFIVGQIAINIDSLQVVHWEDEIKDSLDLLSKLKDRFITVFAVGQPADEFKELNEAELLVFMVIWNFVSHGHLGHSIAESSFLIRELNI